MNQSLTRGTYRIEELKAIFHLIPHFFAEFGGRNVREGIQTTGNGTLVRQISADATFVFGCSATDEAAVENQTILRCVSASFQGAEEGFLGTKNLDSGSWALDKEKGRS